MMKRPPASDMMFFNLLLFSSNIFIRVYSVEVTERDDSSGSLFVLFFAEKSPRYIEDI